MAVALLPTGPEVTSWTSRSPATSRGAAASAA
jgi:hypothetical protein